MQIRRCCVKFGLCHSSQTLTSQSKNVDSPIARPRTRNGNISDCISQVTGEMPPCWNNRNVIVMQRISAALCCFKERDFCGKNSEMELTTGKKNNEPGIAFRQKQRARANQQMCHNRAQLAAQQHWSSPDAAQQAHAQPSCKDGNCLQNDFPV